MAKSLIDSLVIFSAQFVSGNIAMYFMPDVMSKYSGTLLILVFVLATFTIVHLNKKFDAKV